jgi:hypothetical protein
MGEFTLNTSLKVTELDGDRAMTAAATVMFITLGSVKRFKFPTMGIESATLPESHCFDTCDISLRG